MVGWFKWRKLGEKREPYLSNYLYCETKGDEEEFNSIVKKLWSKERFHPSKEEEVRKYFFEVDNPLQWANKNFERISMPHRVIQNVDAGITTEIMQPFFPIPAEYGSNADYPYNVLNEGRRRLKIKKIKVGDVLIVRGKSIADYLSLEESYKIKSILEEMNIEQYK